MSLTNPNLPITEARLKQFYDGIYPYLSGSAHAGFTPVGTIISVMGVTAPANYLACNGQVVNIADYPELADYFEAQFGSKNKFGGDGTSTFGIPDLRGEFLRGTGTNSHTNQGDGASVGVHQDGTSIPRLGIGSTGNLVTNGVSLAPNNRDFESTNRGAENIYTKSNTSTIESYETYTTRPTNTSVLYCIATKNIYVDARFDYSTDEKVVGSWIDGKPIYQKTFTGTLEEITSSGVTILIGTIPNIKMSIFAWGYAYGLFIPSANLLSDKFLRLYMSGTNFYLHTNTTDISNRPYYATIQYTKTTDT